ncbi:MAG: hypothetical protein DRO76_01855 [Candidatus Altiarchaeales archaeon]|nr:MAG: hypothetical protein DRO76_01855 [Candidatus Altiarchaeales archaeon]
MRTRKLIKFVFLFLVVLTTSVSARYITLSHKVTMERIIQEDKTTVNITLLNSGDEPAYDVQLSLLLPEGVSSEPIFLGELDPNMPKSGTFDIKINSDVIPGRYSMAILTEYKDANGYPFSSVLPKSLILKEFKSSQISGRISGITLGDKEIKKLTLELRNMDQRGHNLKIKLFIPRELKADNEEKSLVLNAREEKKINFDISSFGALPGSNYVVFASLDYEDSGIHYSSTAMGIVKVVEGRTVQSESEEIPFGVVFWILTISFIVLLSVFLYLKFYKKRR